MQIVIPRVKVREGLEKKSYFLSLFSHYFHFSQIKKQLQKNNQSHDLKITIDDNGIES